MKQHVHSLVSLACVAVLLGLGFSGSSCCLLPKAVDAVQFPPAQLAWPAVENDYLRGIDDGVSEGDLMPTVAITLRASGDSLEAALTAADREQLRLVPWTLTMRQWADRGIADKLGDGEIGPTVADELTEQVINFTTIIQSLQGAN